MGGTDWQSLRKSGRDTTIKRLGKHFNRPNARQQATFAPSRADQTPTNSRWRLATPEATQPPQGRLRPPAAASELPQRLTATTLPKATGCEPVKPIASENFYVSIYFVRLGSAGDIHRATALAPLQRGQQVVLRTPRGLEVGEVSAPCRQLSEADEVAARRLKVIRPVSSTDQLVIDRLQQHKTEALLACRKALQQAGSDAVLLDIDHLLDGGTLIMQFLSPADSIAQSIVDQVAQDYEQIIQSEQLAEKISTGCGPDCGTESGGGCGTGGGCQSCGSSCHS